MVAVIGLGNMGMAMLGRLVGQGVRPRAFDLDPAKRAAAAALGAEVPAAIEQAVAEVVVLSLPSEAASAAVLAAILPVLPAGAVIADTSTLSPVAARGFARQAAARGCAYLDAPVSGGAAGAAA
uniref:NAD(P)-binding domain-containing protein n=1 Tax=Roseomonas rosulenta TaxID=2748667 RepID=UPI0018DF8C8D